METIAVIALVSGSIIYLVRTFAGSSKQQSGCAGCSCKAETTCSTAIKSIDKL